MSSVTNERPAFSAMTHVRQRVDKPLVRKHQPAYTGPEQDTTQLSFCSIMVMIVDSDRLIGFSL